MTFFDVEEKTDIRYRYGPQTNAILEVARAARRLQNWFPDNPAIMEIAEPLAGAAAAWAMNLVDIILDYEQEERFRVYNDASSAAVSPTAE